MNSRRDILRAHYTRLLKKAATWSGLAALVLSTVMVSSPAQAAQITSRKVTLSSSSPAGSNATTTYTLTFTVPSATVLQSFQAQACTTALGTCTTPTGFSQASSTISQPTNLGDASGWTVSTATSGALRLSKTGNSAAPTGSQTVVFNNVQNPTTANQTFYLRMTTYSGDDWSTGAVDTGTVVASTTALITVSADVAESLTFCTGTSGADCGAISGTSVALSPNPLSTGSTSTGTSIMYASTNALSGYAITYLAGHFTNGTHNFTNNYGTGGSAAATGTEEFGLRVAHTSGTGGASVSPYDGTNYAWNPNVATTVANSGGGPVDTNLFTVTYSANVSTTTPYGSYTSTFTYVCTPTY